MTEKSLSQQICEICDVEPEVRPYILTINGDVIEKEFYPDFEKGDNFVKLFNLQYFDSEDTVASYILQDYTVTDTKSFLNFLLFSLKNSRNSEIDFIKQAIEKTY